MIERIVSILSTCPGLHRVAVEARLGCSYDAMMRVLTPMIEAGVVVEDEYYCLKLGDTPAAAVSVADVVHQLPLFASIPTDIERG